MLNDIFSSLRATIKVPRLGNCLTAFLAFASLLVTHRNSFAQMPPIMAHKVILADEGNGKVHSVNLANPSERWSITTANRDMQIIGNDRLMVSVGDGYAEYNVKTGALAKKVPIGGVVQSAFRLAPKSTFIATDGNPASIKEVDSAGKQIRKITLAVNVSIRVVRSTPARTFLVGGKAAGLMYECDSTGTIKWEAQVGGEPYMALRLPNGNTLISTGYGAQMVLVDSKAKVLKRFPAQADISGSDFWAQAKPHFFAGFQVLKNGNIVVSNWQDHGGGNGGKGFQLMEFDGGLTKVVSYWKQDAALVSSLHGVLVLDSLDTKIMHSDVNGALSPVDVPVNLRKPYLGNPGHRGGWRKVSEIPMGNDRRAYGISGQSVLASPRHSAPGFYILETGL